MKNKIFLFLFLFPVFSCRKTHHEQDLKLFAGTWKIEKVERDGHTIENYGEIIIDANGVGTMKLNYYPYDASTSAVVGTFNMTTGSGIDTYIRLYGAYWLNADGTYGHMMCDKESELSVRIHKPKNKSMQWEFAETTSIYDCDVRLGPSGGITNVKWYLVKQ